MFLHLHASPPPKVIPVNESVTLRKVTDIQVRGLDKDMSDSAENIEQFLLSKVRSLNHSGIPRTAKCSASTFSIERVDVEVGKLTADQFQAYLLSRNQGLLRQLALNVEFEYKSILVNFLTPEMSARHMSDDIEESKELIDSLRLKDYIFLINDIEKEQLFRNHWRQGSKHSEFLFFLRSLRELKNSFRDEAHPTKFVDGSIPEVEDWFEMINQSQDELIKLAAKRNGGAIVNI